MLSDCASEMRRLVETGECKSLDAHDPVDPRELEDAASSLEEITDHVENLWLPGMF